MSYTFFIKEPWHHRKPNSIKVSNVILYDADVAVSVSYIYNLIFVYPHTILQAL
jgi:hypothetical protein